MRPKVETGLWMRSLGAERGSEAEVTARHRLVAVLESLAARARLLAAEIARDHPDFPIHDESHSTALWSLADQIAGPDLELTPNEAFLFGAAALVHDLGMASAAYVEGAGSIEDDPRWPDRVAFALRKELGRVPTETEIDAAGDDAKRTARKNFLRELHAERAEQLISATWRTADGDHLALMEDAELRAAFGSTIGLVAHSHWWSPSVLVERFSSKLGAPFGPPQWTIRPLLVACLLRLADASHLDSSRAPRFLRALRQPSGEAEAHWQFQEKLSQPYPKGDHFVFTGVPFGISEAGAWWLCAEMLKALDDEFRAVDAALTDREEERLAIKGVVGVDDPARLAEYVPTDGWAPADAQVRVSDVVRLVERLGGRELYGASPHVPLRELLQNASDAVKARRALESRPDGWGKIVVSLGAPDDYGRRLVKVVDCGVGMSRLVLTDHLLDFGRSFWETESVLGELPGLLASGFEPAGRFGIGFFSVFMWAQEVKVVSRRYDAGKAETNVLEFGAGLAGRPLLRGASSAEALVDPGTQVGAVVDRETLWRLGIDEDQPAVSALEVLCGWLAPSLDVDLRVEASGEGSRLAVEANDWLRLSMSELRERIAGEPLRSGPPPSGEDADGAIEEEEDEEGEDASEEQDLSPSLDGHTRLLRLGDGTVVGRAHVDPFRSGGVVTVGGFRSAALSDITGVLLGNPTTASRHLGIPIVPRDELARWASEQATLLASAVSGDTAIQAASVVQACGGDPAELPIAYSKHGPLNQKEIGLWAAQHDEVVLPHYAGLSIDLDTHGELDLFENVLAVVLLRHRTLHSKLPEVIDRVDESWPTVSSERVERWTAPGSLFELVLEAIGEAWGVSATDMAPMLSDFEDQLVGERAGLRVRLYGHRLRRDSLDRGEAP